MRRFGKKVNRGLILGAVLLAGLAVFVIFREIQFRREIPQIRKTVQEYVSDLSELNQLPKGAEIGKPLTESQLAEQEEKLEHFLDTYWNENGTSMEFGVYTASDFRTYAKQIWSKPVQALFRDFSVLVPEKSVIVSAAGTGYARVSVSVGDFSVLCTGRPELLLSGLCGTETDGYEGENAEYRVSYRIELFFEMKRVGGEWKIDTVQGYCDPTVKYGDAEVIE